MHHTTSSSAGRLLVLGSQGHRLVRDQQPRWYPVRGVAFAPTERWHAPFCSPRMLCTPCLTTVGKESQPGAVCSAGDILSYVTPKRPKRMGCSCSTPVQHPAPVAAANVPKALPQVKAEKPEAEKPPVKTGYTAGAAHASAPGIHLAAETSARSALGSLIWAGLLDLNPAPTCSGCLESRDTSTLWATAARVAGRWSRWRRETVARTIMRRRWVRDRVLLAQ